MVRWQLSKSTPPIYLLYEPMLLNWRINNIKLMQRRHSHLILCNQMTNRTLNVFRRIYINLVLRIWVRTRYLLPSSPPHTSTHIFEWRRTTIFTSVRPLCLISMLCWCLPHTNNDSRRKKKTILKKSPLLWHRSRCWCRWSWCCFLDSHTFRNDHTK